MKITFINQRLIFRIVKSTLLQLFLTLLFTSSTWATNVKGQDMLDRKVTITLNQTSLIDALQEIEEKTGVKFSYNSRMTELNEKVNLTAEDEALSSVLTKTLKPLGVSYILISNRIVLRKIAKGQATLKESFGGINYVLPEKILQTVSGTVKDDTGETLPGVSIVVKGTTNGTTTDIDGSFTLNVPTKSSVLVFSFVGYLAQEVTVGNQSQINVNLKLDTQALDEVVVVGYGTAKKKDLTGAVSSVNIEDTRLQPNTNASQILRGTTAGVQVIDNGRPGQAGSIRIRGINSISASTDPLIVLDGIIYAGGSLADINPNDIESMDVLKDASSTAVYGSLAANGVIEITTKKGKSGKPKFSLNSYIGASDYAYLPNYLNPEQYLAARKDAEIAEGGSVPFSVLELANIAAGRSINPFDEIKQAAPMSNYQLSVSGKTDKVNYFFSGAYTASKSPVKGDNFSRLSSRLNLGVQATDWLKIGINSGFSSIDNSGVRASLESASYLGPYGSLFLEDGVSPNPLPQNVGLVQNPILGTLLDDNKSIKNILFTNAYADVSIWKGLSYKMNAGYTRTDSKNFGYSPSYIPLNRLGAGSKQHGESQNFTLENIVKYKQKIAKNHNLDLTLLYGVYELSNQSSFLSSRNIFNDALGYNALEIGEGFVIDAGASQNRQISNMARLGYNIASKYFFTLSMRRDGYSAFGEGEKYGIFPAAAFSWNISDEPFFQNISQVDFLKLRASWGRNGNRGVSEYSSLSQVGQNNYVFGDGSATSIGLSTTTLANPNLGWETTESFNVGVDMEAFSERVNASLNFYSSNTFDLLLNQTIPNTNGFENFLRNIGETKNTGFELDVKTLNVQKGNFTWNTNLAFSMNRNKIQKLTGRDIDLDGIEDDDIASGWFIGYPLGSNFDYVFDGIFQEGDDLGLIRGAQVGDIKFKDISGPNGEPDGSITPLDRMVISDNQAKFNMGITNIFSYKNFSLSVALNIREGGESSNSLINPGSNFFDLANFLNTPYWTTSNPIDTNPRINYRNPLGYGFYQDRSFVRLQDVSLSYNVPERWADMLHVSGLQVYASGKNLHTWTSWEGWDPEFGGGGRNPGDNGPLLKTFVGGINVSF
ncbi:SusC/RagA family TonB-linked outer membrane protein [Arcticibacterium luteifluviistationis]|uniref:SusC/RagA family TonB-linked outer membrane protein n=1 Tax=Arcticibacterium luteifluviistationis TaxID=1784714 RepID=A0A2Z4GBS5_9BACT|nr:SusC/RagA family TonB-linked outer membrane protein [Arcticibacterium luteifluviistationis]